MPDHDAKRALLTEIATVGKALAQPTRLELLEVLAQGERSVDELAAETRTPVATCSAHLQVLRRAHLVCTRREGTRIFYRVASDGVGETLRGLRSVAANRVDAVAAAARRYLGDDVEQIDRDELRRRAGRGDLVIIDVRPAVEYDAGHIAGAISIPLDELDRRLDELPAGVETVAYCRGPYCVFAHEAVRRLADHGWAARRLVDGFPEWRDAGLPVA